MSTESLCVGMVCGGMVVMVCAGASVILIFFQAAAESDSSE